MSATAAFAWLVVATAMGFVLSGLGAAVVLLLREPARRVRAIELTLLACLVAPWPPAVPGLPRVAWREWLAGPDVAESEVPDTAAALSEPAEPTGASAVPESTETASSPPIIELAVVPEPSVTPPLDLAVDRESLPPAEPAVAMPIEQAEVPTAIAVTPAEPVAPSPPPPAVELPAERPVDWPAVVVTLYLVGVAAIILLDALGGLALLRVWKSSRDAEPRVQALLSEVAGQSGGRVSLLVSPRCRQPFTFAWLWPVIVLPPPLVVPGKERELRWALAHEWSHVANRHTWGWTLAGLALVVCWHLPFIRLLRWRLRLEQDFVADSQAVGSEGGAMDYAVFLTTQAAHARGLSVGLGIVGGKSELAKRVIMLVRGKRLAADCGWTFTVCLTALASAAVLVAGGLADTPQSAKAATVASASRGSELRYAEKNFAHWQEVLEHDLDPATRLQACKAIAAFGKRGMGPEAVELLIPLVGDYEAYMEMREGDVQSMLESEAREGIYRIGSKGFAGILKAAESTDVDKQLTALRMLAEVPPTDSLPVLLRAIRDPDPKVRVYAAWGLAAHKQERQLAADTLGEAIKHADSDLLDKIARAYLEHCPPQDYSFNVVEAYLDRNPDDSDERFAARMGFSNPEFVVPLMIRRMKRALDDCPPELPADASGYSGKMINRKFVRPMIVLRRFHRDAMPALPTLLEVAQRAGVGNRLQEEFLDTLMAIGPQAEGAARPVLERLRNDGWDEGRVNRVLDSWDEAAGRPPKPQLSDEYRGNLPQ